MHQCVSGRGLKLIKHSQSNVGDYNVDGRWFDDLGDRFWLVRLVSDRSGLHNLHFCFSGGEFRRVRVDFEREGEIEIGPVVQDFDPSIRDGVLDRIKAWEKEWTIAFLAKENDLF